MPHLERAVRQVALRPGHQGGVSYVRLRAMLQRVSDGALQCMTVCSSDGVPLQSGD